MQEEFGGASYASLLLSAPLFASVDPSCEAELGAQNRDPTVGKRVRSTFLESLDKMLALAFDPQRVFFSSTIQGPSTHFAQIRRSLQSLSRHMATFLTRGADCKEGQLRDDADTCAVTELLKQMAKKIIAILYS